MGSAYMEAMAKLLGVLKENDQGLDEEGGEEDMFVSGSSDLAATEHEGYSDVENGGEIDFEDYEEEIHVGKNTGVYVGADKTTVWMKQKLKTHRDDDEESDLCFPGPRGEAENVTDPISSWKVLFDDDIIDKIVQSTNAHIEIVTKKFKRERDCRKTDRREIYAAIGLLYLGGLFKSSHVNVRDLWSPDGTGMSIFHATMSYKRFNQLLRYMCFDDLKSVEEREKIDNLAPVRKLFEVFFANCQESYSVGRYLNIDNMMVPFRGKCIFRHYVPAKAVRYGLKVFPLVDSNTLYTWNMEIYDTKQPEGPYKVSNKPEDIVRRLMAPLFKSGKRNLTVDSWFTSYALAKSLLVEGITMVGLVKQNKPEIPSQFKTKPDKTPRVLYSSIFGFRDDATLLRYQSGEPKSTIWLSTMHKDDAVDTYDVKRTPEIVKFYNSTKGAVSRVEQMIASFSTARITSRWSVVVFFSLLNIAALNGRIILMSTRDPPLKYKSRREYLKDLGLSLVNDHIKFRSSLDTLPLNLRMKCAEVTGRSSELTASLSPPPKKMKIAKKGRCTLCPRSKDKKTKTCCFYCMRLVCHEHIRPVCVMCATNDDSLGNDSPIVIESNNEGTMCEEILD